MRILFVFDHLNIGGSQMQALRFAPRLARAGHSFAVASRGGAMVTDFEQAGIPHWRWPAPPRAAPFGAFRAVREARRLIEAWQPDVIHAHAVLPGVLFSIASRRCVPIVISPHRMWSHTYGSPLGPQRVSIQYRLLRARADHVIACAEGYYREFVHYGVPASMCHLIYNGVDVTRLDGAAPAPDLMSWIASGRLVGTIGRLVEQKRMDVFIEAAARLSPLVPDVRFVIAGDGLLRGALSRQIASLGLDGRVLLLGERRDVPSLLAAMTMFVMTSRWEGVSNSMLEAMAARRPVVATRVPGLDELVEDGVNGLLVPFDDAEALSAAILDLLNDPARAQAMGEAARRRVEAHYDIQATAEAVLGVYRLAKASQPSQGRARRGSRANETGT